MMWHKWTKKSFIDVMKLGCAILLMLPFLLGMSLPPREVGILTALAESDPGWRRNFAGFIAGLREAGWTEGQNFRFEFRYVPGGSVDHLRAAATELIALRPNVILAVTSVAARLVAEQTQSIPIVFLLSIDPVGEGLVASVARPAGNITGFTQSDFD